MDDKAQQPDLPYAVACFAEHVYKFEIPIAERVFQATPREVWLRIGLSCVL
jgi:hypothetical protein